MPEIAIKGGRKTYYIGVSEEEAQGARAAAEILTKALEQSSQGHDDQGPVFHFMIAGMLVADQVVELKRNLADLQKQIDGLVTLASRPPERIEVPVEDLAVAKKAQAVAERAEELATRLDELLTDDSADKSGN